MYGKTKVLAIVALDVWQNQSSSDCGTRCMAKPKLRTYIESKEQLEIEKYMLLATCLETIDI